MKYLIMMTGDNWWETIHVPKYFTARIVDSLIVRTIAPNTSGAEQIGA